MVKDTTITHLIGEGALRFPSHCLRLFPRHPVYNRCIPDELKNNTILPSPAEYEEQKEWDNKLLHEWEGKLNGGKSWVGRDS